jgi:hypothetical protein
MSTFKAPEGATSVSTQQQEFEVIDGVVAVPDQLDAHLLAVGFKRAAPAAVVAPVAATSASDEVPLDSNIDSLNRGQLFALAKERGIETATSDTNDVLRAKLKG